MLEYATRDACTMPKYRSRATLQAGRRLDINELRRSGVRTGEFEGSFPRDGAPTTLNVHVFHLLADGLSRLGVVDAARGEPICVPEVLAPEGWLCV